MKFIVIKNINYLIETYNLLSITHMKVKKTMFIEHTLYYIIKKIQTTWNENIMISIMLLNIIKIFNIMSHSRLLYNFKLKRIDERLIWWIECFLNKKITILKINEHITNKINIKVETSQNFLISFIFFLFYNASILKKLIKQKTTICDFVDDINLLMKAKTLENNCITLINAHDNICMLCVKLYDVKFSSLKYQLCHMIKKKR